MIAPYLLGELACILPVDDRPRVVLRERVRDDVDDSAAILPAPVSIALRTRVLAAVRSHPNSTTREIVAVVARTDRTYAHDTVARVLAVLRSAGLTQRTERAVTSAGPSSSVAYLWWPT